MITLRTLLIVSFITFSFSVFGQKPIYEINISGDVGTVKWMEQSADGTIIIGGEDALAGYNNKTGELKWKNDDMTKPYADWYVAFEPFALFTIKAYAPDGNSNYYLINGVTGEKLFTSDRRILYSHLDIEHGFLLMEIDTKPEHSLIKYDIEKNEVAWETKFEEGGSIETLSYGYSIFNTPLQYNDEKIVATKYKKAFGLDMQSGEILWGKEYKYSIQNSYLIDSKNQVLIQSDKYIDLLDMDTGEKLNEKEIRAKTELKTILDWNENQLLLLHSRGFNILDLDQQELILDKVKMYIPPVDVLKVGDNYLSYSGEVIIMHEANGKTIWNKSLVGNIRNIQLRDEGIFVLTEFKALVIDYEKGKAIDKAGLSFTNTSAVIFDSEDDKVISFDGRKLQTFDIANRTEKLLNKKIKLEKYSSQRNSLEMEIRENGYFVFTDQHIAFFDFEGVEKFNDYYQINKKSTDLGTSILASEFGGSIANELLDDGKRTSSQKRQEYHGHILGVGINSQRLNATYESKDFIYLFTKVDNDPYLQKINKDTGKVEKKFLFIDSDPTYILDEYDNILIIAEGEDTLTGIGL